MVKRLYRLACVLLLMTLIFSMSLPTMASAEPGDEFSDVHEGHAHYVGIMALSDHDVIKGYEDGSFRQWEDLSRQHAAVMLYNVLNSRTIMGVDEVLDQYSDVDVDSRYANEIAALTYAKVFSGYNGKFMPERALKREELATIVDMAFNLSDYDVDKQVRINLENVSDAHKESVQTLANLGFTNQLDDYHPKEATTRGSYATMLNLIMIFIEEEGNGDGNWIS